MTLQGKTEFVLKYIRLGMDAYSAMIVAELTEEEIAEAMADKRFQARATLAQKLEEKSLLEKFDEVMKKTADAGDSKDLKWKLKTMNPRYGDQAGKISLDNDSKKKRMNISISFDGAEASLENADNVEIYDPGEDDAPRAEL